ncbi:hypothetical protein D1631_15725 [Chryseobacterium nematophagum]|uniref:Uncharacterized protein n=1 Tax=Chryseobacterium nematophagum TaxID=2305228 RepID=A0A3M7TIA5_9FLAO|nr:hypothetical protein [Chryseobacterium nematophagum]RNA63271.1 hypothetical protein D1631_15725 [Chryseobacterium nematophagum]
MKKLKKTAVVFLGILIFESLVSCNTDRADEISSPKMNTNHDSSELFSKNGKLPNFLNDKGRQAMSLSKSEKKKLAFALLSGRESVQNYTAGVCYEAVAFVRFLLGDPVPNTNQEIRNNYLYNTFSRSNAWNGRSDFNTGDVIVFSKKEREGMEPIHTAIATGHGCEIRGVNGGMLGSGWRPTNIRTVLAGANSSGEVRHDGTTITIRILRTPIIQEEL